MTEPIRLKLADGTVIQSLGALRNLKAVKLSDDQIAEFKKLVERPEPPKPTAAQIEANRPYAEIVKDGQVVAKVYKGGTAETSNALGARLRSFFEKTDDRDERAAMIAKTIGGKIRYV